MFCVVRPLDELRMQSQRRGRDKQALSRSPRARQAGRQIPRKITQARRLQQPLALSNHLLLWTAVSLCMVCTYRRMYYLCSACIGYSTARLRRCCCLLLAIAVAVATPKTVHTPRHKLQSINPSRPTDIPNMHRRRRACATVDNVARRGKIRPTCHSAQPWTGHTEPPQLQLACLPAYSTTDRTELLNVDARACYHPLSLHCTV